MGEQTNTDNKDPKKIKPIDLVVGSGLTLAGVAFLALVFAKGSESETVIKMRNDAGDLLKKFI